MHSLKCHSDAGSLWHSGIVFCEGGCPFDPLSSLASYLCRNTHAGKQQTVMLAINRLAGVAPEKRYAEKDEECLTKGIDH